jgi:hypothetical protein
MIHLKHIFVTFANVMEQLKEKYEKFKAWQIKPHEVKKLSAEKHVCATCHTEFHGNFCPRCGQKAVIGRYSFKTAFLLFLDVWGLGNRGMFRTIRDLLLRPGYMIRDYLNGMQMAYFPPFKMFFLLIAFLVLVNSGLNIRMMNTINNEKEHVNKSFDESVKKDQEDKIDKKTFNEIAIDDTININGKNIPLKKDENSNKFKLNGREYSLKFFDTLKKFTNWVMDNQTLVNFLLLLVLSGPMYLLFRKNKKFPDVRYSEFFVSMVYITNMMTIIDIIGGFFLPGNSSVTILASALSIIPLKQLYGYSYSKTLFKVCASFATLIIAAVLLIAIVSVLGWLYLEYIL